MSRFWKNGGVLGSNLPICCNPAGFAEIQRLLPRLEAPDTLLAGAVALSTHAVPDVQLAAVKDRLTDIAQAIELRVHGRQPQARVAYLHDYLFDELHFAGNEDDYYSPENSLISKVLESRRGLPITLSLIYVSVARLINIPAWGIGLPGHFVVGVEMGGAPAWVDPFAGGRITTPAEAQLRIQTQFGPEVEWSEQLTQPVDNRYWLTRMLQNLLASYSQTEQYAEMAATLEMELLLWPEESRLERDLALVLARIGRTRQASAFLEHYLDLNPDDPQRTDLQEVLAKLG